MNGSSRYLRSAVATTRHAVTAIRSLQMPLLAFVQSLTKTRNSFGVFTCDPRDRRAPPRVMVRVMVAMNSRKRRMCRVGSGKWRVESGEWKFVENVQLLVGRQASNLQTLRLVMVVLGVLVVVEEQVASFAVVGVG
jgi:hypothetical protein